MFARVSEVSGPTDQLDRGIAGFHDQVVPALKSMDGFVRAYLLVDRSSGKTLSITVWETEDAMQASEEAAANLRASVTSDMGATATIVGHFDVVDAEPSV